MQHVSNLLLNHKLKTPGFERRSATDSMVLAVISVATIYWVLDSILNIFFSNKFNLIAELIGPDLYDIYIRVVVLCLFIIFGSHAQSIINRLKFTTQRLNESEELWRSLVETAPDVITTVDRDGTIRFINQNLSARPSDNIIGQNLYALMPEEYQEIAKKSIESVFETGETAMFEVRLGDARKPAWYTYRVGPLRLNGEVIAATIISTNTTEFKRAEELIRYKELFDNVAEGVFILDAGGRFIETNDRVLETSGYSKKELKGMPITRFVVKEQQAFVENMLRRVSTEHEARFELNVQTKSETVIPNEINCRYVSYLGEMCILCVARDITQTKQLQNQLIRSERLAATGQLAASIAHEINSPLQGITALLNVIRSTYENDKNLLKKLDLIKSAFGSIRDTVRNLIDLNRPGREKKQPVDINQIIESTTALVRSYLKKSRVGVHLDLQAKASNVFASPQQLGQVFMNLINNAVESINSVQSESESSDADKNVQGEIRIESFSAWEEIVIRIKDTGTGIDAQYLDRIFDPFFTRKKTMGMGVGLTICHGIIEDHNGFITAENDPAGGAVFTIRLPLNRQSAQS